MRARFIVIFAVLTGLAFAWLVFAIAPDLSSFGSVLAVASVPQERPDKRQDTVSPSIAAAITPIIQPSYINQKCGYTFQHSPEVVFSELGQPSELASTEWQAVALRLGSLRAALVCHDIADSQNLDSYAQTAVSGRVVQNQQDLHVGEDSLIQLDFIDSTPDGTDALAIRRVLFMMGDGKVLEVWLDRIQTDGTVSRINIRRPLRTGVSQMFCETRRL